MEIARFPRPIPRDSYNRVTPELLEFVVQNPELWVGKYEGDIRLASFVYIGKGKDEGVGFRLTNIAIDDSVFRDGLWEIINKSYAYSETE